MWTFKKKVDPATRLEAFVAPAGSTVVLRSPQQLSSEQRARLKAFFEARHKEDGVRFVLLDGAWEAVAIGALE